jgi:hypothetical protein
MFPKFLPSLLVLSEFFSPSPSVSKMPNQGSDSYAREWKEASIPPLSPSLKRAVLIDEVKAEKVKEFAGQVIRLLQQKLHPPHEDEGVPKEDILIFVSAFRAFVSISPEKQVKLIEELRKVPDARVLEAGAALVLLDGPTIRDKGHKFVVGFDGQLASTVDKLTNPGYLEFARFLFTFGTNLRVRIRDLPDETASDKAMKLNETEVKALFVELASQLKEVEEKERKK